MTNPDQEMDIKIVMVGESSVGKTSITDRIVNDHYEENVCSTLGTTYSTKKTTIDGHDITFQIWDTAGQEKYRGIAPMYFRGAHVALCIFSVLDQKSFAAVDEWIKSLNDKADPNILIFLIANKIDLADEREVTRNEGMEKARKYHIPYHEVSAKTAEGFETFLYLIGKTYMDQTEKPEEISEKSIKITAEDYSKDKHSKKNSCC
ncbi:Ras-related protein Rab-5A [Tritrichomonas foetus]|uniref:Ras-related protein Rab-5A n=1 Tax=Tritrichomonas foetus TaxID=1144522 RepID=A0A1J4K518_9EUKA|nr:Ras-related protein Rab-5A [Tritrichomonas foetus]|eukprot:OHT04597.1 Ras-related protein Rab-5A [Tritrichomonas foetus]